MELRDKSRSKKVRLLLEHVLRLDFNTKWEGSCSEMYVPGESSI